MGLLSKATAISEKEERAKGEGFLERSSLLSESRAGNGMLERAEKLLQSEESEAEEGETQGLLQKARALTEEKEGLLEKATAIAEREEGLLGKVTVVEEERPFEAGLEGARGLTEREKMPVTGEIRQPPSKKKKPRKKRAKVQSVAEATVERPSIEKPAEEIEEERAGWEKPSEEPSFSELLADLVKKRDLFGAGELFSRIIGEGGYELLFRHILKTACMLGKGESGILFVLQGGKFKVLETQFRGKDKKSLQRLSYREGSKFVTNLKEAESLTVRSSKIGRKLLKRDRTRMEAVEPWEAIPIVAGPNLVGFFVVGNILKRAKTEHSDLLFLSHLSALFVVDYALKEDFRSREEQFLTQQEKLKRLLGLYDYCDERKGNVRDALDRCSVLFHIKAALLVTGWERKGALDVSYSVGLTDEERRRFKVTRGDREIAGIVKKGEPGIPKDRSKRLSHLEKELERTFRTYIVVPVIFHGIVLAALFILDMKGGGKTLSKAARSELAHAVRYLVPYLLYTSLTDIDPFRSFEFDIENWARESEREDVSLTLITCIVRNIEKKMDSIKYTQYRAVYERLYRSCLEIVARDGSVKMASWKQIAIFIRDIGAERAEGIINRIKERFAQIVTKERLPKLSLSFKKVLYEKDGAGLYGLLNAIY